MSSSQAQSYNHHHLARPLPFHLHLPPIPSEPQSPSLAVTTIDRHRWNEFQLSCNIVKLETPDSRWLMGSVLSVGRVESAAAGEDGCQLSSLFFR